ncbi:DUF397 domain-containing protein [Glycomyces xiaoerkulensis]|uniref:DUF397 domain-containing protein n=1 Tax=Glycomyces xiaoerkulensis TaxID=2038139 RepID=UPI000C2623FA|nr:DUF397 domain-containing protein [Glycomyces xiaoerkulensis]
MATDVTAWRKSTRSGAGNNTSCVEIRRTWRKSTRSGAGNNTNCVEVALCADDGFHLRDSKLGDDSPVFDLDPSDFAGLLRSTHRA